RVRPPSAACPPRRARLPAVPEPASMSLRTPAAPPGTFPGAPTAGPPPCGPEVFSGIAFGRVAPRPVLRLCLRSRSAPRRAVATEPDRRQLLPSEESALLWGPRLCAGTPSPVALRHGRSSNLSAWLVRERRSLPGTSES